MIPQPLEAALGPIQIEADPRFAPDGVAAPAEVAECHVPVGKSAGQGAFPVAVALLALDQRAADEHDPVAILERKLSRQPGGRHRQQDRQDTDTTHGRFLC